ncbi:MAG TPA: hypothetical protein PLW65_19695 [Pseudomonadota bacterium]|nr:hypothetical protein [Pseudomonadota bacterium]
MARLAERFTVHALPAAPAEHAPILARLGERVRFLQTTGVHGAPAAMIEALPRLEIIGCMGVGVDAVDLALAKRRSLSFSRQRSSTATSSSEGLGRLGSRRVSSGGGGSLIWR